MTIPEERVEEVADRYYQSTMELVHTALGHKIDPADPAIKAGLEAIGRITESKVCDIVEVSSSLEGALVKHGERYADGIGCRSLYAVAQDMAAAELLEEEQNADTLALRDFCARVYDTILYDELSVLIPWPDVYHTDDNGDLHCETGPAVAWGDEEREFFWHGQGIDSIVIESPDDVTAEYLRHLPAEQRRASYEALGHDRVLRILALKPKSSEQIDGLSYSLYVTDDGEEAWLEMQSPPLQDGSQPTYIEPVHENCTTCAQALAWRATGDLEAEPVTYEIQT
jgi:hypothetical protein